MDFFEHQERARRQTRWLVFMFILALTGIVIAVDILVAVIAANAGVYSGQFVVPGMQWATQNAGLLAVASLATGGLISMASLFRVASLSSGGGKVARGLGGTLVTADSQDPLRRRLHNVVEEMAIASGVPVPEVYVLEQEQGLNAFAAGFTPGDAAVAVTRGSLEHFNREELQGVIAHEFSHVLNGDMRLNMRLIGILFGIMVISVIGRTILRSARRTRFRTSRSSDRAGGIAVVALTGMALSVIGYLGLFFARLIKAAISRQREYLADASAVQFTRQTEGIAGALKKIAYNASSLIESADGEEVSHMLFANGLRSFFNLYATHPPIEQRIRALEPGFDPAAYLREQARQDEQQLQEEQEAALSEPESNQAQMQLTRLMEALLILTPGAVSNSVGNPSDTHIQHASMLRSQIPASLYDALRSPSGALLLTLALLLDRDPATRARQTGVLSRSFVQPYLPFTEQIHGEVVKLGPQFRLPLMDLAFPVLKRRPREQIDRLLELVNTLIEADGHVDTFEYLLSRVLITHLEDADRPQRPAVTRRVKLSNSLEALHTVFSVVARLGHREGDEAARDAYQVGMLALLPNHIDWPAYDPPERWIQRMDTALDRLDRLPALVKEELIKALTLTITHDGKVTVNETELLRAVCVILHCPLPPFVLEQQDHTP